MLPFDSYPHRGRALLGKVASGNCHHGYGLKFRQVTGQTKCAYCGHDFTAKVLACAACNGFFNRYKPSSDVVPPRTLDELFTLRDRIFKECVGPILRKHDQERHFFSCQLWERKTS